MNLFAKKVAITFLIAMSLQSFLVAQSNNPVRIDSVTVQQVLDKYYKAMGGLDKLESTQSKLMKSSTRIKMKMANNTSTSVTKMIQLSTSDGKNVTLVGDKKDMVSKVYYDGQKGYTYFKSLNTKTPFDKKTKSLYQNMAKDRFKGMDINTYLPEVYLESVYGKQCYVIENTDELADGSKVKNKQYYAIDSGLLYTIMSKTPQTSTQTILLDYTDIDGHISSMSNIILSKTELATSVFTFVYEAMDYDGPIDTYFTKDDATSAQQINALNISYNKHDQLLETYVDLTGDSTYSGEGGPTDVTESETASLGSNLRDEAYKAILDSRKEASTSSSGSSGNTVSSSGKKVRVTDMAEEYKDFKDLKYRRSSLYTLMINDPSRERNGIIRNAFGNTELSTKFNDHNVGPYLIQGQGGDENQIVKIEQYLNDNGVAKELVAKWFNRDADGNFNMDLVAERGQYNASDLSVQIAKSSKRGIAILKDAGEELIGNTFVIVYDYKYTNKEESAKKRKGFLRAISSVARELGSDDVADIADGATVASDVIGKGYFVRTSSYLYRLVWDDETANTFYSEMWIDKDNPDPNKKKAFETSNLFKLKYVGSEISRTNLQSTIFTKKNNDELIEIATTRAVDKNIGKLQRTFEEFRVKTPLLSGDPISAKIGTKEGIEKGDKFEVLEQLIDENGVTSYKRMGTIRVDAKNIWDNAFLAKEQQEAAKNVPNASKNQQEKKRGMFSAFSKKSNKGNNSIDTTTKPEYTIFIGKRGKYASGMLIRQIN